MKMNAHVLGIDPGSSSGAALFGPDGEPIATVQLTKRQAHERAAFVRRAVKRSWDIGTDLIVVREKWQKGGPKAGPSMHQGLGTAWGLWLEQFYLHAPWLPPSRFFQVYPSTWRSVVLNAHAKDSLGWERVTANYVRQRFGVADAGGDEQVAMCLAAYAFKNAKIVASAQDKPRWHRKATGMTSAPSHELVMARKRILELEENIAAHALLTKLTEETIDEV